ncbi:MAG: 50S ribosomal protein L23 [Candidatus Saccharibacteria bacterium]|nr:50S ribosomal protein L23 [Candidatus Saccharibacteria bacterium]
MAETKGIKLNMLEPRATEKTYAEQTKRVYVFPVDMKASKQAIAKRVEDEFNVKVTEVKTLIRKGKKTRFSKGKHAYPGITYRKDRKFAYVKLAEGNSIRVFEEQEDNKTSAKEVKKAEAKKADVKKADKNAGKENK